MPDAILILALAFTISFGLILQDDPPAISSFLPDPPSGWVADGVIESYDQQTIFEYMDGAGEVYLSFDYREMVVQRLKDADGNEIVIELYDMGNAADAFGIFVRNLSGEDAGIGQGSEYQSGYLLFWQDRYFCTVFTYGENEITTETILALGKTIADKIGKKAALPSILDYLPSEQLDSKSIRYFHLYTDLNQHYFIADENILDLGKDTNAVLAQFGGGRYPAFLVIIQYPSPERANIAYEKFMARFMPEALEKPIQIEDGTWVAAKTEDDFIITVFDANDQNQADELLVRTTEKIREKKHE